MCLKSSCKVLQSAYFKFKARNEDTSYYIEFVQNKKKKNDSDASQCCYGVFIVGFEHISEVFSEL